MFLQITPKFKQSELEASVLKLWQEKKVFQQLVAQNKNEKPWVMVDGPVTANNRLGVHHGWGRTYKDIFQRFHSMTGHHCLWQNGFDCQGLWVEVEVEKELGINGRRDIESTGIEKFTKECRKRVNHFSEIIIEQSKLLGQWADWQNSYRTDSTNNILHIWKFLKKCHEKNLVYQGIKVMPWCTRCGTSLSQHEMTDSYQDRTDTAIDFLCPLRENQSHAFLVWTTTPWTVPANTALAVHPTMTYVLVEYNKRCVWMSLECKQRILPNELVKDTKTGMQLVGTQYMPPYPLFEVEYKIVPWNGIDKDTGSGIVHIAPAFGVDDYNLWNQLTNEGILDLPYCGFSNFVPVDENGIYTHEELALVKGQSWQKANTTVAKNLAERELLFKEEKIVHRYPHCWRCKEPVIYRQSFEVFIAVSKIREVLLSAAEKIEWKPAHSGLHMKDWLQNMGDWCISRRRFWGLPLPFYKCDNCRYLNVIGSLEELAHKAVVPFNVQELYHVDIHRPHIDAHQVLCDLCGKAVSRIKEVGDCWLDAGIVPFSTFNYNLHGRHQNFPFDFAVEMREQVRLWFYSTLVMSVVLEGEAPFKTIMTYDEMRDNKGDKFSKTKGNAPSLDKIIGEYGADVLRYALAEAPTDQSFCFTDEALKKGKKTFNTLWNCLAYFAQYANADKPDVLGSFDYLEPLDFWLIKRLSEYINETNTSLKDYNAQRAIYSFTGFVNDLSTWYIRMKRPVFAGSACEAKTNSYRILYCVLRTVTIAMAPLFPFTAEEIYQKLILRYEPTLKESVHLMSFPTVKSHVINQAVLQQMTDVRDVVQSILSIRNTVKCKVRQPLRKAIVENWKGAEKWQCEMIAQEVNVLEVTTQEAIPEGAFKVTCHNMNVFLNVELDAELKELGAVRELIRAIQDKRKDMGLVVSDKIALFCVTENSVWDMLNKHLQEIVKKTNSDNFTFCEEIVTDNESKSFEIDFIDGKIKIVVVKAYL